MGIPHFIMLQRLCGGFNLIESLKFVAAVHRANLLVPFSQ